MKVLATASLLILALAVRAQKIEQYCSVETIGFTFENGIRLGQGIGISIDYGDGRNAKDRRLRDENDETMRFPSIIAALNYMAQDGWVLKFVVPVEGGLEGDQTYIMAREVQPDQAESYNSLRKID